jgi:3-deoxy-D-manno-octulosonate 8-phosphate phosphatase (KDO 8-P phosphatase)
MEHLCLPTTWVGVPDKLCALQDMLGSFGLRPQDVCFIGDGREDAPILASVGLGLAVSDAHPDAQKAAHRVLPCAGGMHVLEEVELILEASASVRAKS